MKIPFVKMSGAGNDMILVDHRARFLAGKENAFARGACDRRRGVGADGVILLEESGEADFHVRFFNPDGGEYGLCGNGARCVPFFAAELGFAGPVYRFSSASGTLEGRVTGEGRAGVQLAPVGDVRLGIQAEVEGRPVVLDYGAISDPHAVLWVDDVPGTPVDRWGAALRRSPAFGPAGTNVSFARVVAPDRLEIRTFERGVEGETLACGSGSTVVATLARAREQVERVVRVAVRSGDELTVHLPEHRDGIPVLEGPVTRPFQGVLDVGVLNDVAEREPAR